MIYKTPQQHNSAIKTTLTNGIRKLLARRKYSSVKPVMLKEVLEYHQKINDIEVKRMFCEDLAKMQKVLPVITMDKGLMLKVKKVLSKHGFALMHMSDDMYLSTTLMHKAGFSMSTKIKLGVTNAKRTNIINMLNLSVDMAETPDNKETVIEDGMELDVTLSLRWNFIDDIKKAVENGEGINYKSGNPVDTLENRYKRMVRLKRITGAPSWDECIKVYDNAFYYPHTGEDSYKDTQTSIDEAIIDFLESIKFAIENGEGINYKWGPQQVTLETDYKNMLEINKNGSDVWDECIEAYQKAFFGIIFINGAKFAVENEKGTNYKFNPPSTMSLEKGYKQLLATKKETGTNDLNEYIDYYEDVFYEEVFIYAINESLKYGKGIKHKFTANEFTLEDYYRTMLIEKVKGSEEYDICIKAYEEAFFESVFMNAIKQAVKNGEGIKYKFGFDKRTLEQWHNSMLVDKGHGAVKWDAYITAYDDAFNCKGSHDVDKVKDDEDKDSPVTTLPKTDTEKVKVPEKKVKPVKPDLPKKPTIKRKKKVSLDIQFIDAIKESKKDGKGIKYKFGDPLVTLESAYNKMLDRQLKGSKEWDSCITAYEDAFYEEQFIKAIERAVKYGKGIKYKFGKNLNTLEYLYEVMITKQDNGSTKDDNCITAYQTTFYEEAFMSAIDRAQDNGLGTSYKFGVYTIERVYKELMENKEGGADNYDDCITKYQDTFQHSAFIDAVDRATRYKVGINYKFGEKKHTLENVYKGMVTMQDGGSDKWDAGIKKYRNTFPKTSFMDAVKRAKQNGQNGAYWFIKNEKTLKSFFDEMIIWEGAGDQEYKECVAWYIHNFGWNPS